MAQDATSEAGSPARTGNVHLPYHHRAQVHHRVVAGLAHRFTPSGSVLDIGCGLGYTLAELRRLDPGRELYGADMDPVCLEAASRRVEGLHTIRMGETGLDVASLGRDHATCILSHVLEHLPHPQEAVHRLLEVVRPGGHMILAVPNPVRPTIMLTSLLRRRTVNPGHLQAWDRSHWMNFLENWIDADVVTYAADEVRILPGSWKRFLPGLESLHQGLARLAPWWSFSNIAVIRRPVAS